MPKNIPKNVWVIFFAWMVGLFQGPVGRVEAPSSKGLGLLPDAFLIRFRNQLDISGSGYLMYLHPEGWIAKRNGFKEQLELRLNSREVGHLQNSVEIP